MPATAMTKPVPYFGPATTKYVLTAAIASTSGAATRAEINAGTDITKGVADFTGGTKSGSSNDVHDWSTLDPAKVPGWNSIEDIVITGNASVNGTDIRTLFTQGNDYTLIRMERGDTAAYLMDVFNIKVQAVSKQIGTGENAKVIVNATTTSSFSDIAIPA